MKKVSRREFLKGAAIGAAGVGALGLGIVPAMAQEQGEEKSDWLGTAPAIADAQIAETLNTELLIIGAGNGGLTAAATAADYGMEFILCEQNEMLGSARVWVGAVNTKAQADAGISFDAAGKNKLTLELARYASYKCDMSVINAWVNNSAETVAYLADILDLNVAINDYTGQHVGGEGMEYYVPPIWHTLSKADGSRLDRHAELEAYINGKGYEVSYAMRLEELVKEGDAVAGAIFQNADDKYVKILAKNTILATGGYPGNPEMLMALAPIVNESCTANSYYGTDKGQGIKAGIWAGAKRDAESAPMIFDRGIVAPGVKAGLVRNEAGEYEFPGTVSQFNAGTQPHLKVNKEGLRFANESCPYDFFNHAAALQTDGVYAMIVDANVDANVIAYDQYGCARISVMMAASGGVLNSFEQNVEKGLVIKADTIEELAAGLGIPADTLTTTVARYNELCEKGADEDFGKEAYRMIALDTPPYYGAFCGGSLLTTCDGLRINDKCQVYDTEHQLIDGLYCVGDCSGSFFSGNYPEYLVGVAVGRTITQGRLAVKAIQGDF